MEQLDLLSEAVIDTLKEFSNEKRLLTPATLKEAFAAKKEIVSLIGPVSTKGESNGEPVDVSPVLSAKSEASNELDSAHLYRLQELFLKTLDNLGPMIKDSFEKKFNELEKKIDQCASVTKLISIGDEINIIIGELIEQSVERIDFSNDFLVELSKELYKVEEQLFSYQTYNKESHQINSDFNDNLLSETNDLHRAFSSIRCIQDMHTMITSKLSGISKAIQDKCELDETRQQEVDSKIIELQENINTYKLEILQVKERSESLKKEVMLDELTQINNRRAYDLQMKKNLRRYHRNKEPFSLILIDIDHFKRVNDDFGHKAGDKCLKEIANLIKSSLRRSDFLARYGGEEIIAILQGSNAANAQKVAEKIRRRIEQTRFHYQGKQITVTISLGVTEYIPSDTDPETPFIRVDEAMYRAKREGRNRVCVITDLSLCKIPDNHQTGKLALGVN